MKLISAGLALLGSAAAYSYPEGYGYGNGFLGIEFGGDTKWGTVSWIGSSHLMVFSFPNDVGCDGYPTKARVYANPAAVNDVEVPAAGESKAICSDLGAMQWEGDIMWNYDPMGKECIGVGSYKWWPSWYIKYFNTITLHDGTDNVACAAMAAGGLCYGMATAGENTEAMRVHIYRSPCRKSRAYHYWFADDRSNWNQVFYKKRNCRGPMMGSAWAITDGTKQSWHQRYNTWRQRSFSIDGVCFNDKSMGWKKSKAKVCAKREGIDLEFCQDNIFVPTKYTIEYNPTSVLSEQAGGYHIHKLPTDMSDQFSCGDTSGHFNPYSATEGAGWPAAMSGAGHYEYETGDLSRRYGSLDGKAAGWEAMWCDYNIPLHGMNNVKDMSVVWHRASDNSRYTCTNIMPKPHMKPLM